MILIPNINPIPFSLSGVNEPKTEYAFYRDYHQKYQRSDITKIQILIPDEEPVKDWALSAERMDDATVVYTAPKETFDGVIAGHRVVEFGIDFSTFQEGTYRFILQAASGFKYRSDIICVKETHEYTRLLSYTNSYNDYGVDFSRGTTFNLRVESQLYKAVIPKSEDSTYSDNMGGYRTLSSSPYNNDRLNIGGTSGIPDWLVKIINQAFSCNILQLNGIGITKVEGATFEAVEQDNYNLRGWNIEIGHIENTLFYEEHLLTVNGGRDYTLDASFEGGANVVVVSATSGWRVLANLADWLNITPTQGGIYGTNAQVSLLRNKTKNARTNVITLRLIDRPSIAARITVTQDAIPLSATWSDFSNIWESIYNYDAETYLYYTTDTDVAGVLQIADKRFNAIRSYSLLSSFLSYPALTLSAWQQMLASSRTARISAFLSYVSGLEDIDIDAIQTNGIYRTSDAVPGFAGKYWLDSRVWENERIWDE